MHTCLIMLMLLIGTGCTQVQRTPTLGEELIGLEQAMDKEAINEVEYEQLRARLLDGVKSEADARP